MIGELLANPELLENFTGPESLGELFGTGKKLEGKKTATVEIGENTVENANFEFILINILGCRKYWRRFFDLC